MIINLFTKQTFNSSARHEFSAKVMKATKNYSVNADFTDIYTSAKDSQTVGRRANDMVELSLIPALNKIGTTAELKEFMGNLSANINKLFKERIAEIGGTEKKADKPVTLTASASVEGEKKTKGAKTEKKTTKTTKATKTTKTEKKTEKKAKEEEQQILISQLNAGDIKKMGIKFYQYSPKCVSLVGETKRIKEQIKDIAGGHWNHARQCWFLKNDEGHKLAKVMGQRVRKMTAKA